MARRRARFAELAGELQRELVRRGLSPRPGAGRELLIDALQAADHRGLAHRAALDSFDAQWVLDASARAEHVHHDQEARLAAAPAQLVSCQDAGRIVAALGQVIELAGQHDWATPDGHELVNSAGGAITCFGLALPGIRGVMMVVRGAAIIRAHEVVSSAVQRLESGAWPLAAHDGTSTCPARAPGPLEREAAARLREVLDLLGPPDPWPPRGEKLHLVASPTTQE